MEQYGATPHWKKLGLYLDLPFTKLGMIEADHAKVDDRIMTMLDHWLRSNTATKQGLINALRRIAKTSTN